MQKKNKTLLSVRTPSGLSGDMFVAGLARMAEIDGPSLEALVRDIRLPQLEGAITIQAMKLGPLAGWRAIVTLPEAHTDRSYSEIRKCIAQSALHPMAKGYAEAAFAYLAEAEAAVHDLAVSEVVFHEVGALDSILDICLSAALFERLRPARFICSPLPLCDGVIECRHGPLSAPAPAVLKLLKGIPVYGVDSSGETVTPTALALLKAFEVVFGLWPEMVLSKVEHVFGSRTLANLPNGAIFALGSDHRASNAIRPKKR